MIGDGKPLFLVREQWTNYTYFWTEPFITELIQQKPYAQWNKLFTIIESFQRYIPSDKSIVLNKER
jgi:hypothetical protein